METVARLATMDMDGKHESYTSKLARMKSYSEYKEYKRDVEDGRDRARNRALYNSRPAPVQWQQETFFNVKAKQGPVSRCLQGKETCWSRYSPENKQISPRQRLMGFADMDNDLRN
jgi:hypothetical protein